MNAGCWVIGDGRPGHENQSLGLAEAVGLPVTLRRVRPGRFWGWPPAALLAGAGSGALAAEDGRLAPPWPRLAIGCGRGTVAAMAAIRRASGGATFCVQLQHPQAPLRLFDLVVAPRHDRLHGANVIATRGSLHRVTAARLAAGAAALAPRLGHLPRPLVAVLVGGSNRCYRMTAGVTAALAERLARLAAESGAGLMVTASRRTGVENRQVLASALAKVPAWLWDGQGDNPYFGMLGLADHIVVTGDSVAMVSEACATGRPVHVMHLEGGNAKFRAFHAGLEAGGFTRPFTGRLDDRPAPTLDDLPAVAAEVCRRLEAKGRLAVTPHRT